MSDEIKFRFKYQCDDCRENNKYRKSCSTCNIKEVCLGDAGIVFSEGTETQEFICPFSGNRLRLTAYDEIDEVPFYIMTKMNKNEIKADRRKRSTDHFKKHIFPTLPRAEQIHFTQKYKDLKPTLNLNKAPKH